MDRMHLARELDIALAAFRAAAAPPLGLPDENRALAYARLANAAGDVQEAADRLVATFPTAYPNPNP